MSVAEAEAEARNVHFVILTTKLINGSTLLGSLIEPLGSLHGPADCCLRTCEDSLAQHFSTEICGLAFLTLFETLLLLSALSVHSEGAL